MAQQDSCGIFGKSRILFWWGQDEVRHVFHDSFFFWTPGNVSSFPTEERNVKIIIVIRSTREAGCSTGGVGERCGREGPGGGSGPSPEQARELDACDLLPPTLQVAATLPYTAPQRRHMPGLSDQAGFPSNPQRPNSDNRHEETSNGSPEGKQRQITASPLAICCVLGVREISEVL